MRDTVPQAETYETKVSTILSVCKELKETMKMDSQQIVKKIIKQSPTEILGQKAQ